MFSIRYMMISYFCAFFKQPVSMQDEGSFDSSSLKAFQNKSLIGCFLCYVLAVERMKFKTNLGFKFSWLFFILSWIPTKTWMWTNSGNQLPSIFFKGVRCETSKEVNFVVCWCWMQRNGCETKEVGAKPTCYCLTFMCCQPCLPNLQCFQSCVSWTPFCIFSFFYFSNAAVSGTSPWVAVP